MDVAHGLGGGSDLPIPASLAIAGGTAALTLSFVVLLLAWHRPRFGDGTHEHPVPPTLARVVDGPALAITLRVLGLAFAGFVVWAALAGPDTLVNPTFGVVYVWLWVGLVPMSLLFGRFVRAVSPARTLHLLLSRALGSRPDQGVRDYPAWLGYWPAAIGVFAFVWLELVYPSATYLGPLRLWFAVYLAVMLVGGAVYGDRWLERADPFEAYSTLVSHLSVWGRDDAGALVLRSPLRNLARLRPEPGLVAVVAALVSAARKDERLGVVVRPVADTVTIEIDRPVALAAHTNDVLLSIDAEHESDGDGAPLLGTGFALRLAQNLAVELGGVLTIGVDRLTLRLPTADVPEMERAALERGGDEQR